MAVNLSPVGGVAAQFFDNSGYPLTGGKLYSYAAGTTTPAATYTSSNGLTAHSNPIVLDAAGRVPAGGEIWLTDGIIYKFVLKTSTDTLIATYDNITGINSNSVSYTNQQEIITATAGQTVFNLGISYQPATNSLSVFVDGVNQYGPGAQYSYVETDSNTVTFNTGLHVGAEVKFTTTQQQGAGAVDASQVTYTVPLPNAVTTNVEAKLAETVSVMDFGAVGDGVADDTTAFANAIAASNAIYVPPGTYLVDGSFNISNKFIYGDGNASVIQLSGNGTYECVFWNKPDGVSVATWAAQTVWDSYAGFKVSNLRLIGTGSTTQTLPAYANWVDMPGMIWVSHATQVDIDSVTVFDCSGHGISQKSGGFSSITNCFFDYVSGNGITLWGRDTNADAITSYTVFNNGFREIDYNAVDCFACFGVLILGNIFEKIYSGVRFGGTTAANTLCRTVRLIGNYLEVSTKGLLYRNTGADATYLTVVHNETDNLGDDGAGGNITDFPPVLAFDNAVGSTRGWMYRTGGVAELLSQTARAQAFRGETLDLIDAFNTSFGQLKATGSYLNNQLRFALEHTNANNSLLIEDEFGSYQIKFARGNQTPFGAGANGADTFMWIQKDGTTSRSINAAGTVNASGADYAEYMEKSGEFTIEKGEVVGINSSGKLTNQFDDSVSFVVKSTNPSYVGNDNWGVGLDGNALETARQSVDRIAFAGQVPVNIVGAVPGQFIIPTKRQDGGIEVISIQSPTFEQYQIAVGKVISIENESQARIIVKVA